MIEVFLYQRLDVFIGSLDICDVLRLQRLALLFDILVALQDLLRGVPFALYFSIQLVNFFRHFFLRILDVFHFVSLLVSELSTYHAT